MSYFTYCYVNCRSNCQNRVIWLANFFRHGTIAIADTQFLGEILPEELCIDTRLVIDIQRTFKLSSVPTN